MRRILPLLVLVILAAPLLVWFGSARPGEGGGDLRKDPARAGADMEATSMPAEARALLATGRPWRAARLMRRYLQLTPGAPADHRFLAARAEAGWGAWSAAARLLEGLPALDTREGGIGLYLLGRARGEGEDDAGAIDAYRAFLALSPPAGQLQDERAAARLRLGLALLRRGEPEAGRTELELSEGRAGEAAPWLRLLEADALAARGDTAAVRGRAATFDEGLLGLRAWRARVSAARHAGDLAAARALANAARRWARTAATRTEFLVTAGLLAIEMGDRKVGRDALVAAIARDPTGEQARRAAKGLGEGAPTPRERLALARVARAQGLHEASLQGFRAWLAAGEGSAGERAAVHLEHASALFYAERYDEVAEALRPVAALPEARSLRARAEERLGSTDVAVRLYLGLAEERAGTPAAAEALYLAAAARHDAGEIPEASALYRRVVALDPGGSRAALARARLAGIAFVEEDYREAARLWERFRSGASRGDAALQGTYWSARAAGEAGDSAAAARRLTSILEAEPDSYYALLAGRRLGKPFWPLPMRPSPADDPAAAERVAGWMFGVDLLRAADFQEEASAEADRVVARAGRDRATLYALGEALAERGYSQGAIRIGLRLGASGVPDRRLLRLLYPFPHRTLITEEARERGLDPAVAAALIRRESLFESHVTSPAGARGLMQIMPATGASIAEEMGMERWDPELLYHPEINVHIGIRYLVEQMERYDRFLPAVFAAYNAGPQRVDAWMEFPESGGEALFTERIPFGETREYVKILTRNRALYQGLYGND